MVWAFIIGGFILFWIAGSYCVKLDDKRKANEKLQGILYSKQMARYLGGFPEVSGGEDTFANIQVKEKDIFIEIPRKQVSKNIPITLIEDISCTTTEQISKDVTLGRLLVFGFFALGMKKTKKEITKCAVLTYRDEFQKNRSVVFEMNPDEFVSTVLNIKRNLLIEHA